MTMHCKNLPPNWKWVTVEDITLPVKKVQPKNNPEKPFVYIDISSIDNNIQKITDPKEYIGKDAPSRARQLIEKNDVLFSTVRTYLMNIAYVPDLYDGQIASTGFSVLRSKDIVDPKFLYYYCLTKEFLEPLNSLQRGTSYPAIRDGDVRAQLFPLAPLDEQSLIVEKIEELFSQLDAGIDGLKRAQAALKRYRASVLKAAFEGRLVPQDPNDEPAWELVNKLNIDPNKLERTKSLPESWVLIKIDDIANTSSGGTPLRSKPEYFDGEIPWIKSGELRDNIITDSEEKITSLGLDQSSAKIFPKGTTIVALYGATVGRTGILDIDAATNQAVCAVIPKQNVIISKYLFYWLQYQRRHLLNLRVGGAQPNISQRIIRALEFPLSPSNEQQRIVTEIERLLSILENIEHMINTQIELASNLGQAILKSAFSGKLISEKSSQIVSDVVSNGNNKNSNQRNDSITVQGKLF